MTWDLGQVLGQELAGLDRASSWAVVNLGEVHRGQPPAETVGLLDTDRRQAHVALADGLVLLALTDEVKQFACHRRHATQGKRPRPRPRSCGDPLVEDTAAHSPAGHGVFD